jgi:hypothetical protein
VTGFDLVFALFGLLLGLAVAEVLSGFIRTIKVRKKVRIGWLTPLLGALVILDQTTLWMVAFDLRDAVPLTYLTLVIVLAMVGGYYLLSTLIFPDDPAECPDFDDHYHANNRIVLSGVLLINLAQFAITMLLATPAATMTESAAGRTEVAALERGSTGVGGPLFLIEMALLVALILAKNRRANLVLLSLLIGLNLGAALFAIL